MSRSSAVSAQLPGGSPPLPHVDGCEVVAVRTLDDALRRAAGSASLRLVMPARS
jgi:hypothetical protein